MPLCLKDAVYQVRKAIGELQPFNWSDFQIITDLNYGARQMCSVAGALTGFQNLVLQTQTINQSANIPSVSTLVTLPFAVDTFTVTNNSPTATLYFNPTSTATTSNQPIAPLNSYTYSNTPLTTFYILGSVASGTYKVSASTGIQEAALPIEIDEVKACKFFSGQLFDLEFHDWKQLQTGASSGGIPIYYYIKTETRELTPQSTDTSDIIEVGLGPNMPLGDVFRTVLGVWPIPATPTDVHVWYSYFHPWMTDPTDPCSIPSRFLEGWAAYGIAACLEIEKAIPEADRYRAKFEAAKEEYRIYASKQKQGDKPARYGTTGEPWRRSASSSVIFLDPYPTMGGG